MVHHFNRWAVISTVTFVIFAAALTVFALAVAGVIVTPPATIWLYVAGIASVAVGHVLDTEGLDPALVPLLGARPEPTSWREPVWLAPMSLIAGIAGVLCIFAAVPGFPFPLAPQAALWGLALFWMGHGVEMLFHAVHRSR